jgi:hypothetical protein
MINLLVGLSVFVVGGGLFYIGNAWKYGEDFLAVLSILGLAYCVGWLLRWVF